MILRWTFLAAGKLAKYLLAGTVIAVAILTAAGLFWLERQADLKPWHERELSEEFTAAAPLADFQDYLRLEERLFGQLDREIRDPLDAADRSRINRFNRGSLSDPGIWPRNWNRSYVLEQDDPKAVFVLIHGMSDSPYSLRHLALRLHAGGGQVIGLRLPGHGTIPAGLLAATWEDMAAAVALAVEAAERRAAGRLPVYIVGYSIGAALAVHHSLIRIDRQESRAGQVRQVDGLILISPAIGLTPLASLAVVQSKLGRLLGLRKVAWSSIGLEYDPFKYVSFAINAAHQSYLVTKEIQSGLARHRSAGRPARMPPILAFQSAVDATVSTEAVVRSLFENLPEGGHELVIFDVNHMTDSLDLLAVNPKAKLDSLLARRDLTFAFSVLTNRAADRPEVVLRRRRPQAAQIDEQPTGLAWPAGLFSLTHVALPIAPADPVYGDGSAGDSPGIRLGMLALRGERSALRVSAADMLRLRWNPFYAYLEDRVLDFTGLQPAAGP